MGKREASKLPHSQSKWNKREICFKLLLFIFQEEKKKWKITATASEWVEDGERDGEYMLKIRDARVCYSLRPIFSCAPDLCRATISPEKLLL